MKNLEYNNLNNQLLLFEKLKSQTANYHSAVAFHITEKQLQDIASAQKVMLSVDSGKDPLKVELNGSDKNAIDLFLSKCCKG